MEGRGGEETGAHRATRVRPGRGSALGGRWPYRLRCAAEGIGDDGTSRGRGGRCRRRIAGLRGSCSCLGGINQRKGAIVDTEIRDEEFTLTAEVSLNDMFGYASTLRGITQGKGEFTMEYLRHSAVLPFVQKEMIEAHRSFAVKK